MGNSQSRVHCRNIAHDAFINAQDLHDEIGGPQIRGAIVAYLEGRIDAERMIRGCTQLEVCCSTSYRSSSSAC